MHQRELAWVIQFKPKNQGPLFDSFLDYNDGRFLMKAGRLAESKVYLDHALVLAPEARGAYCRLSGSLDLEASAPLI